MKIDSQESNMSSKLICKAQKQLRCKYKTQVEQKAQQILHKPAHPVFKEFSIQAFFQDLTSLQTLMLWIWIIRNFSDLNINL